MNTYEKIKIPWPGWRIVAPLGRGAYGNVYEIERDVFGNKEKAAMKIITIPQNQSEIEMDYSDGYDEVSIRNKYELFLQDIVREYQVMSELRGNSNVVNCEDLHIQEHSGEIGWDVFIRMELLEPLSNVLKKREISESEVIQIGKDICQALILCEKKNIIHRDVKPENIFLSPFDNYKLGDFGIAKTMDHTTNATKAGTERYMAPEVVKREKYGKDVDIYSLGLVMYWLLNKRRMPFLPLDRLPKASEMNEAIYRRLQGEVIPEPVEGSRELKKIVLKACSCDRAKRYESAKEMLKDLEAIRDVTEAETQNKAFSYSYQQNTEQQNQGSGFVFHKIAEDPSSQDAEETIGAWKDKNKGQQRSVKDTIKQTEVKTDGFEGSVKEEQKSQTEKQAEKQTEKQTEEQTSLRGEMKSSEVTDEMLKRMQQNMPSKKVHTPESKKAIFWLVVLVISAAGLDFYGMINAPWHEELQVRDYIAIMCFLVSAWGVFYLFIFSHVQWVYRFAQWCILIGCTLGPACYSIEPFFNPLVSMEVIPTIILLIHYMGCLTIPHWIKIYKD